MFTQRPVIDNISSVRGCSTTVIMIITIICSHLKTQCVCQMHTHTHTRSCIRSTRFFDIDFDIDIMYVHISVCVCVVKKKYDRPAGEGLNLNVVFLQSTRIHALPLWINRPWLFIRYSVCILQIRQYVQMENTVYPNSIVLLILFQL